jgi:Na+:H+ antiporter, NhaA family
MSNPVDKTGQLMISSIAKFIRFESSGGIVLVLAAAMALLISNSSWSTYYISFLDTPFVVGFGDNVLSKPVILWINDGLMVIFFLLVGLEIKRELIEGELNSWSKAILPVVAALGGMIVPALIYLFINWGDQTAIHGWAIPVATDIAFALGLLSLLGARIPLSLKVFLTAIAILDDLGAILIIAIFYTSHLSLISLAWAMCCIVLLFALNRMRIKSFMPYALIGIVLWVCVLKSGIHATLAGVVIAMAYPLRTSDEPNRSPLRELEHTLHPWVAFGVMPLFAFANAGVPFTGLSFKTLFETIPLGIACGLFFGKQIGIFFSSYFAIKTGLAQMPTQGRWSDIYGIALLCGIGFTMSLFIGTLAFSGISELKYQAYVRLGVLSGSLLSGIIGYSVLYVLANKRDAE